MKIYTLMILFGLLGFAICNPLDTKEATDALVEIEKQRLIKFPEELELPNITEGKEKHDEAKRILQEIEKINQSLGYVKKQSDQAKSPAILDSSQYLFPNAGYQPFHVQSPQILGANGETLLLPSIRSVKLEPSYYNKAGEYNAAPARKSQKEILTKDTHNSLYFKPQTLELRSPQLRTGEKFLPTHFVIPVRLYKQNKQEYLEKHTPQEYKIKGYKIVGDIDHFYGKSKTDKTSFTASRVKSTPKFQLFVLPEETLAKTPFKDIKSNDENSMENSSREEKLANRPYKVQSNTQAVANGNTVNATSTSQIIKKKLVPKKGAGSNPVISASSSTVVKLQPATNGNGHQQQQSQQQHTQQHQHQQQHFQKPLPAQQITQIAQPPEATPSYTVINNQPESTLQTWPLQPSPLTAYTAYGLNLLTPGNLQQNLQPSAVVHPSLAASTNFAHFLPPQYLSNQQPYFAYNNGFLNAPFGQYGYTTRQQYLPRILPTLPTVMPILPGNGEKAITPTTTKTTILAAATKRPIIKDREPTTRKPQTTFQLRPPKLEVKPEKITQQMADFKNDAVLLKAIEQINPKYVIEEIVNVPGRHVYSTKTTEQKSTKQQLSNEQKQQQTQLGKKSTKAIEPASFGVKVEATGRTSTKGNIPQIPFGTYFLPYFSQNQVQNQQSGKKVAALILEPHSKAIVGNGGTAISTPISKAYLKRGVTTNVYFNPESVAIAGVGGKAHAQADLELDLIN